MITFQSYHGMITRIENIQLSESGLSGCYKLITITSDENLPINFIASPETYFVDHVTVSIGDIITGFYDAKAPIPLIYPPRYAALFIAVDDKKQSVTVDYFNHELVNTSNTLKLNIGPRTMVLLKNDQQFTGKLGNQNLLVIYRFQTKSIPSQTTPEQVIVIC